MTSKLKLFNDDEFSKSQGITQAEYARRRGVSRQIISRQVQLGIIKLLPNGNIDPAKADKQLEDNLNPAFTPNAPQSVEADNRVGPALRGKQGDKSKMTFNKVRTLEKGYDVKLKELVYKEKVGELVNRVKMSNAYRNKVTAVVGKLQKVADRICEEVARESDRLKCRNIIYNDIKASVEDFDATNG